MIGYGAAMTDDPLVLFDRWYAEAKAAEPNDPNAMALSVPSMAASRRSKAVTVGLPVRV